MKKKWITRIAVAFLTATLLLGRGTAIQAAGSYIDTRDNISLWVGDSRTVLIYQDLDIRSPKGILYRDMEKARGKYITLKYRDCYAERGSGYNFVVKSIAKVKKTVAKEGRQNVVFASGVNDIYKTDVNPFAILSKGKRTTASPETLAKQYWKLYKKNFIKKYPEDYFYLMSVNPVYCSMQYRGNSVTNSKIDRFNKKLKSLVEKSSFANVFYVDTNTNVFKKQGLTYKKSVYRYAAKYRTLPLLQKESANFQLHYSDKVNKKLYKYVNQFIAKH